MHNHDEFSNPKPSCDHEDFEDDQDLDENLDPDIDVND